MGLGSKIKDALHGDHHDKTSSDARPPGAFPQDDIAQKHADGKNYIAPHGSLVDKNRNTSGHAGTTGSGRSYEISKITVDFELLTWLNQG